MSACRLCSHHLQKISSLNFSYGQGPVDGDKVDPDTSFSLHLSVMLKLQIMLTFPCFHFLKYASLFSRLHTEPITQQEQKCLGKSPEKA